MTTPITQVAGTWTPEAKERLNVALGKVFGWKAQPTRQYLLLEVETSKDVPDLSEKVAGRAWPLDGVTKTTAMPLTTSQAMRMAMVEAEVLRRG